MQAQLSQAREGVGRCRGPAHIQAAGHKQGPIRSSMEWGPPPPSSRGQPGGHESAQGALGSPGLTTCWWWGRPWGWAGLPGQGRNWPEGITCWHRQALTSFSTLRNPTSTSAQKAPLGGFLPWSGHPLGLLRAYTHPAEGRFPVYNCTVPGPSIRPFLRKSSLTLRLAWGVLWAQAPFLEVKPVYLSLEPELLRAGKHIFSISVFTCGPSLLPRHSLRGVILSSSTG